MVLRRESRWRMALGKINGRPVVTSATSGMYPLKWMKVVLQQNKDTHLLNSEGEAILKHLDVALAHMYRMMGIKEFHKVQKSLSFDDLNGMYLGSSGGYNSGPSRSISTGNIKVDVSPHGKKFELHESDIQAILKLLRDGTDVYVTWHQSEKDELYYTTEKQWDSESYQKWKDKCRAFVIPSSVFVVMERLISHVRMLAERGPVIRVGHKWSRGGMWTIAQCLGIDLDNCWEEIICEGDISGFDFGVMAVLTNLYYSSMFIHEDPSHPDHPLKEILLKCLIKNMVTRITHFFGRLWGIQVGGVPSGCYNTSHMDSWVMALYFCLFAVHQILRAPPEIRGSLEEEFIRVVRLIVYGDDHNYNKGKGVTSTWFSIHEFTSFLKKAFGVELRGGREGSFCSRQVHGWLVHLGTTFLRHQAILNPHYGSNEQPPFLPFRETKEYIVRAVWGRTASPRDIPDVMLSVLGHAFGTHGSNYDAWKSLKFFYKELLQEFGASEAEFLGDLVDRVERQDIGKMRQHGITVQDLAQGFPLWETLIDRNKYDPVYQDIKHIFDDGMEVYGLDDVDGF